MDTLFMIRGGQLYYSTDDGRTWALYDGGNEQIQSIGANNVGINGRKWFLQQQRLNRAFHGSINHRLKNPNNRYASQFQADADTSINNIKYGYRRFQNWNAFRMMNGGSASYNQYRNPLVSEGARLIRQGKFEPGSDTYQLLSQEGLLQRASALAEAQARHVGIPRTSDVNQYQQALAASRLDNYRRREINRQAERQLIENKKDEIRNRIANPAKSNYYYWNRDLEYQQLQAKKDEIRNRIAGIHPGNSRFYYWSKDAEAQLHQHRQDDLKNKIRNRLANPVQSGYGQWSQAVDARQEQIKQKHEAHLANKADMWNRLEEAQKRKNERKGFLRELLLGISKLMKKNPIGDTIRAFVLMLGRSHPKIAAMILTGIPSLLVGIIGAIIWRGLPKFGAALGGLGGLLFGKRAVGAATNLSKFIDPIRKVAPKSTIVRAADSMLLASTTGRAAQDLARRRLISPFVKLPNWTPGWIKSAHDYMHTAATAGKEASFGTKALGTVAKVGRAGWNIGRLGLGLGKAALGPVGIGIDAGIDLLTGSIGALTAKKGERWKAFRENGGNGLMNGGAGAAIGAIIGSVVPGIGTALGAMIGYWVGKIIKPIDIICNVIQWIKNHLPGSKDKDKNLRRNPDGSLYNQAPPDDGNSPAPDKSTYLTQAEKDKREKQYKKDSDYYDTLKNNKFVWSPEWHNRGIFNAQGVAKYNYQQEYAKKKLGLNGDRIHAPGTPHFSPEELAKINEVANSADAKQYAEQRLNSYLKTEPGRLEKERQALDNVVVSEQTQATSSNNPYKPGTSGAYAWDFLAKKGLSPNAIAGVLGNLQAESGLEFNRKQGDFTKGHVASKQYTAGIDSGKIDITDSANKNIGYGVAQWTSIGRKKGLLNLARQMGKSVSDPEVQMEWLWRETNSTYYKGQNLAKLLRNKDVSVHEASDAWMLGFERPADQSVGARKTRAQMGAKIRGGAAGTIESVKANAYYAFQKSPSSTATSTATATETINTQMASNGFSQKLLEMVGAAEGDSGDKHQNLIFKAMDVTGSLGVWGITHLNNEGKMAGTR